jgi:hypothetical protein
MFSTLTSHLSTSFQGNSQQQHAPQYSPAPQQTYNNASPQVPGPWMAQWSATNNCWFYVNQQTGQSSWVNPMQQQHQPQNGYQVSTFSPPPQQQPQQRYQNNGFTPPPKQLQQLYAPYNPSAFPAPPQQLLQLLQPQYAPQSYNQSYFQPPP